MPLFFNVADPLLQNTSSVRWYQPMLFYLIALVLRFLPLSEASIRLPTAIIGVLNVMLMYPVANRLFKSTRYATLASLMLLLTPAHMIFSRQGLDYVCLIPLVLGWLWCLMASVETDRPALALAGGVLLGFGFYSYIAAWILMPCFLLLTWLALYLSARRVVLSSALAGVGFALPLLALIPWLWSHPDMLRENLGRYGVYDTRHLSVLQGAKDFLNYNNVQERLSVYWDYFNPAFLFFTGGSNLTTGTRRAGVFLIPMAAVPWMWRVRRGEARSDDDTRAPLRWIGSGGRPSDADRRTVRDSTRALAPAFRGAHRHLWRQALAGAAEPHRSVGGNPAADRDALPVRLLLPRLLHGLPYSFSLLVRPDRLPGCGRVS